MIWGQAGVCFLLWVAYGWWLRSRTKPWLGRVSLWEPKKRAVIGSAGLIAGGALAVGALFAIASLGGIRDGSLTAWACAAVVVSGLAFVHLQSFSAVCLVSSALDRETAARRGPSGE
ncbi:MAG: hypothetical protein KF884_08320 [Fimbriimonadaceae bacterium]|nr:hypothetical protein [Fimbriimonadaceae bacterium]QYK57555.1 MAG: hypothetical protein KF884_08320 [Fimbriimonadaceae bacterium]